MNEKKFHMNGHSFIVKLVEICPKSKKLITGQEMIKFAEQLNCLDEQRSSFLLNNTNSLPEEWQKCRLVLPNKIIQQDEMYFIICLIYDEYIYLENPKWRSEFVELNPVNEIWGSIISFKKRRKDYFLVT